MARLRLRIAACTATALVTCAIAFLVIPAAQAVVTQAIGAAQPGSTSLRPSADFRSGSTYQATVSGVSTAFRFYARGGTASQRFTAQVFATNSSGQPTTRLGSSAEVIIPAGRAAGWVSVSLRGVTITTGTRYTLAVANGATNAGAWVYYTPETGAGFRQTVTYPGAATWGTITLSDRRWSFALDVETATGDDTAAGRFDWGQPLAGPSDEFNYGSATAPAVPDQAKWQLAGGAVGLCWPGHAGNGYRCDKNTRVYGGVLRLTGQSNGDTGWLASKFGRRYGRWEARVRSLNTAASNGRQYHPLLIIWPDSNRWPDDGEYDYLENGAPGQPCAEAFMHYPHPNMPVQQEFARETNCGTPLSQWHNVAFEWTATHVAGFINGREWFRFSGGANAQRSCMQCMPSGHQTIQLDNFYGTNLTPAIYEVDWYREYAAP